MIYITHSMEDIARFATRLVVFNKGAIAMDDEPGQVFRHVEQLESMGLTVPSVTKVMSLLKGRGLPVEDGVYTVHKAMEVLLRLKGGGDGA